MYDERKISLEGILQDDWPSADLGCGYFSAYSWLFLLSLLLSFAVSRIVDFIISGLVAVLTEAVTVVPAWLKVTRRKPSEDAITRYEILAIKSLDERLKTYFSPRRHFDFAIPFALYIYWRYFLGSNGSVLVLVGFCVLFLITTSGYVRRKSLPALLNRKRVILKESLSLQSRFAELRKLRSEGTLKPRDGESEEDFEKEYSKLDDHEAWMRRRIDELQGTRYIFISSRRTLLAAARRLIMSFGDILSNPIGLSVLLLSTSIYVGYARADLLRNDEADRIVTNERSACGRILLENDRGHFVEWDGAVRELFFYSTDQVRSINFESKSCEVNN